MSLITPNRASGSSAIETAATIAIKIVTLTQILILTFHTFTFPNLHTFTFAHYFTALKRSSSASKMPVPTGIPCSIQNAPCRRWPLCSYSSAGSRKGRTVVLVWREPRRAA